MLGLMTPVIYFEGAASFYSRILWIWNVWSFQEKNILTCHHDNMETLSW
jgi:hypothetical protein